MWFLVGVLTAATAAIAAQLRYQAPDECKWISINSNGQEEQVSFYSDSDQQVSLVCNLRTINSELENTNFSAIQTQYTARLKIVCSDSLYFHSSLSPGSLQTLSDLKELNIEYCKIANLTAGIFRGLHQLRNLTLKTFNTDWPSVSLEIYPGSFTEELGLLDRLELGFNNIWRLPEGIFCPLYNLQYLNLTSNRLRDAKVLWFGILTPPNYKRCAANLRTLDLSNNSFDSLPDSVFSKLTHLKDLQLHNNGIYFMADHAFDGLTSLLSLNLANNKLVNLPPEVFLDTKEIKELYLQNNSINVLAPGLFNGLSNLHILDLSDNEITSEWINTSTFAGLLRLVFLNVAGNQITKLETSVFRDLYSLQILKLEDNQIESIAENTFISLNNLHSLTVSGNKLSRIDSSALAGLYGLSVLSLEGNLIEYVDPGALRNSPNLQELHLNNNKLFDIPFVLTEVPHLKTLDLGNNQITQIYNTSFSNMQELVGLRLTENNLTNISKGLFDKMVALRILNLSSNKIKWIEPGTLDTNQNLLAIRLDGNYLTEINNLFNKLPNLIWLNISENLLQWFDYALIPTGLQWLDIHSNQLTELGNYFEIENQLHLTTFDASNNKLTNITGSAIPDSIEILNLSNNLISKVQSYTFFKKPYLTRVELRGNQIKSLTQNSLRISTIPAHRPLPQFYIADNPFKCDCTMQWLQQSSKDLKDRNKPQLVDLEEVTCKLLYNRANSQVLFKEASPDQFLCQYESNCFPICHCCDFDACDCEMTCPTNCTCYHDLSWSANIVDCSRSGYSNNLPYRIPMDTTQLYLDGNEMTSITSHSFIGRRKLQVLFLNNSNIEIIHNRTFNSLQDLQVLRLNHNKIARIQGFEFEALSSLKELYLENNRIEYVGNNTFIGLVELKILRLDFNRLVKLAIWELNSDLVKLRLAANPWSCDCTYAGRFRDFILFRGSALVDAKTIRCYNGTEWFSLLRDNITCLPPPTSKVLMNGSFTSDKKLQNKEFLDYIPLAGIVLGLLFLATIVTFLVCACKHDVRLRCHPNFAVRLFYKNQDRVDDLSDCDKPFDAFVSYSSKDEAWVSEELAPVLEQGENPYKLCLHYREFPVRGCFPGEFIAQAVDASKRTVMVLSQNYVKSERCRFEFKSAHHNFLRDRRKRLIVIMLGEVCQKDLDPEISLYLKSKNYLRWGDKQFWEKLKLALPDVRPAKHPPSPEHHHSSQPMQHIPFHHSNQSPSQLLQPQMRPTAIHI